MSDREALDEVFSFVYEELRHLARKVLRGEYQGAEVTPTTLVHELWLRLASAPEVAGTSRLHFRRIAARAMRHFLVDAARRRRAEMHGGGLIRVPFDQLSVKEGASQDRQLLALDSALDLLERRSPRQAQLVEARFFGGLTCQECADLIGVSETSVMRDWRAARAWLAREIRQGENETV